MDDDLLNLNSIHKTWLICPMCNKTIPEIFISTSSKDKTLIDIKCYCINSHLNYREYSLTIDPDTYLDYCIKMSNARSLENKSKRIYCFICDKWLNDKEFNLHRKITFTYPHIFAECKLNIGVICEDKCTHHPNVNSPSKYFCVTHGKHICTTCSEKYHSINDNCFVYSLKDKKCQVNEFYKNKIMMKDTQSNQYNIIQKNMRDYLFEQIVYNKNINISDSIRKILEILFRTYFLISEKHYPNYNLAQSIINLDLNNLFTNTDNAFLNENTQLIQNVHSINYVQTMNFFPSKYSVVSNSNIFVLKLNKTKYDQFLYYHKDNFYIGEVKVLNENISKAKQQNGESTLCVDELLQQNNDDVNNNNKKNYILKITNPKLTISTQHIKILSKNRLAIIYSKTSGNSNKEVHLNVYHPKYSKETSTIINYKLSKDNKVSSIKLSNNFNNFIGICDYTYPSNIEFQHENETTFFYFGDQISYIISEHKEPIIKEKITTFNDVFAKNELQNNSSDLSKRKEMPDKEDLKTNRWKNFHHFIPFPIQKSEFNHLLIAGDFLKELKDTLYLTIENTETTSNILAFLIDLQSTEVKFYNVTKTKSKSIISFSYLHKEYIALGSSDGVLEIYRIKFQLTNNDQKICTNQQDDKCITTCHKNGVHSINVINDKFFITGGGNGEFVVWNIINFNMMNVVYDNERNRFPINKVIGFNCPFGENTLVSCFNRKGIAFWISQSDVEDNER